MLNKYITNVTDLVLDPLSWIIPMIIATLVSIVVVIMGRGFKISDKTISGTIRIENIDRELGDIRETMSTGFERMERNIEKNRLEISTHVEKLTDKLVELSEDVVLHEYRIDRIERSGRNGGTKSAV